MGHSATRQYRHCRPSRTSEEASTSVGSLARITSEPEKRRTSQPGSGSTIPWLVSPRFWASLISGVSQSVVSVGKVTGHGDRGDRSSSAVVVVSARHSIKKERTYLLGRRVGLTPIQNRKPQVRVDGLRAGVSSGNRTRTCVTVTVTTQVQTRACPINESTRTTVANDISHSSAVWPNLSFGADSDLQPSSTIAPQRPPSTSQLQSPIIAHTGHWIRRSFISILQPRSLHPASC